MKPHQVLGSLALFSVAALSGSVTGQVKTQQKVSDLEGGFTGILDDGDRFGWSVGGLGDVDGDGVADLAVGAIFDDDGGVGGFAERGAVWILFLNPDGTVKAHQKISETTGGFTGDLDDKDDFAFCVAGIGDLDGDSVSELAVGSRRDDDGGTDKGAVWILFLNTDGTVKSTQKISATSGGFSGSLDVVDDFGYSVTAIGDLDGDHVPEIAVGAFGDDDGGSNTGAVWILFLNADGTVKQEQKISATSGGFGGSLPAGVTFGSSVAPLGDLNRDGVADVAIGASATSDGGFLRGAVWIVFLAADGTVVGQQKISATDGGFTGGLSDFDLFGSSVAEIGDVDRDGVVDLAVTSTGGGGSVWLLFLQTDGTVKGHRRIAENVGGFSGPLTVGDFFAVAAASIGDLDQDGRVELAVGAPLDGDGGGGRGAVWNLFLGTELDLSVSPNPAAAGDQLTVTTAGGVPGQPVFFFVSSINGLPTSRFVTPGLFPPLGTLVWSAAVPAEPCLPGNTLGLVAYSFAVFGEVLVSNEGLVTFQ